MSHETRAAEIYDSFGYVLVTHLISVIKVIINRLQTRFPQRLVAAILYELGSYKSFVQNAFQHIVLFIKIMI